MVLVILQYVSCFCFYEFMFVAIIFLLYVFMCLFFFIGFLFILNISFHQLLRLFQFRYRGSLFLLLRSTEQNDQLPIIKTAEDAIYV